MVFFSAGKIDDLQNVTQHGQWSVWGSWGSCLAECGGGIHYRSRSCDNPEPMGLGEDCHGKAQQVQACNTHSCEGMILFE